VCDARREFVPKEAAPLLTRQWVQALLAMQANAPPGTLAAELEVGGNFHLVVHQASGMVAAQLEVSVAEGLARLRAYAFANDVMLSEIAEAVVTRRLRFD